MTQLSLFSVYGFRMATEWRFSQHLAAGEGSPDLLFSCSQEPPEVSIGEREPLYESGWRTAAGESSGCFYRLGECDAMRLEGADFYLWPDRIHCHLRAPDRAFLVAIWLLGPVLCYWLERRGLPSLHAAAVVREGHALGFLASSKAGKSSLASALIEGGCELLSDDILPLQVSDGRFDARPGYPQMRLWPDQAERLVGAGYEALGRVQPGFEKRCLPVGGHGWGRFCATPRPLKCLYLPERATDVGRVEISPLTARSGLIELVRHSFSPFLVEALGMQAARLDLFARLVTEVPIRRLVYPEGLRHLPRVVEAVLGDLESSLV